MATTNKSTTKKPTAKKSSKPAKTTKKVVTKTSVQPLKSTTAKKPVKREYSPVERLRAFNFSLTFAYAIFAGLVIGFVTTAAKAVTLPIAAKDVFASDAGTVLGTAHEVVYNIEPKYVLAAALVVSAVASLLWATKLRKRYEGAIASQVSGWRWIALGVSAALLFEYVALLTNITDIWVIKLSSGLILLASLFGWIAERDNIGAARPKWLAYILSLLTGALAWLPILGALVGTTVFSEERYGWHVYALAASLMIGSIAFAVIQYRHLSAKLAIKDYALIEMRYLSVDRLVKLAMVLITLGALK